MYRTKVRKHLGFSVFTVCLQVYILFTFRKVVRKVKIEIRNDSVILDGYVNVTSRLSNILSSPQGPFVEEILPKTFDRALSKGNNVELLFNHDPNHKLGSTQTGELQLREDNIGLRATANIKDSTIIDKAKQNLLQGWSFGFSALKDNWTPLDNGLQKRSVEDMYLAEVSILDKRPAYVATSVEMRGNEHTLTEMRSYEDVTEIVNLEEIKTDEQTKANTNEQRQVQPDISMFENELTLLHLGGANKWD
jgi:HK97 family phage prohead protease